MNEFILDMFHAVVIIAMYEFMRWILRKASKK